MASLVIPNTTYHGNKINTTPYGLPHFNSKYASTSYVDPVSEGHMNVNFLIDSDDNEFLSDNLYKMSNDSITFNMNIIEGKIKIFNKVLKYLNKPIIVEVSYHDKEGKILYKFVINEFKFTKLPNIFSIDYSSPNLKNLIVNYTFESVSVINMHNQRRLKLSKLLGIEQEHFKLNRDNII